MMEGMGWTAGKGLGAAEQGSTTHVKVNKRALQLGGVIVDQIPFPNS